MTLFKVNNTGIGEQAEYIVLEHIIKIKPLFNKEILDLCFIDGSRTRVTNEEWQEIVAKMDPNFEDIL